MRIDAAGSLGKSLSAVLLVHRHLTRFKLRTDLRANLTTPYRTRVKLPTVINIASQRVSRPSKVPYRCNKQLRRLTNPSVPVSIWFLKYIIVGLKQKKQKQSYYSHVSRTYHLAISRLLCDSSTADSPTNEKPSSGKLGVKTVRDFASKMAMNGM